MDGALARWLTFAATLLVVGASVFRFGVLRAPGRNAVPPPDLALRAATTALIAAGVLGLVAAPLRLIAQTRSFLDPGDSLSLGLFSTVLGSAWGRAWTVQVLAAGLAAAGALFARVAPSGWYPAAVGASAVVLATPLTGHATGSEHAGSWGYPLDALHVLGASAWIGTLGVMVIAAIAPLTRRAVESRGRIVADLVHAFHPVALTSSGITILAGTALSLRYLQGSFSGLWTSTWGKTLLVKLLLLAGVAGLGAWNSRVLRARLGSDDAALDMRKSAVRELTLALLVLAATAVLVASALPGE